MYVYTHTNKKTQIRKVKGQKTWGKYLQPLRQKDTVFYRSFKQIKNE